MVFVNVITIIITIIIFTIILKLRMIWHHQCDRGDSKCIHYNHHPSPLNITDLVYHNITVPPPPYTLQRAHWFFMLMTLTKGFCNLLIKELSKRPSLGVHSPEELACKRPDGDSVVTMSCAWFPAGGSSRKHGTQLGIVSQQVISDRLREQRKTCLS